MEGQLYKPPHSKCSLRKADILGPDSSILSPLLPLSLIVRTAAEIWNTSIFIFCILNAQLSLSCHKTVQVPQLFLPHTTAFLSSRAFARAASVISAPLQVWRFHKPSALQIKAESEIPYCHPQQTFESGNGGPP